MVQIKKCIRREIRKARGKALSNKNITVYLETNALLLRKEYAQRLSNLQYEHSNFNIIIHLDAIDVASYNAIYKNDNLNLTLENLDYFLLRCNKNTYLQIVKQKDNFDNLKDFYAYFDKYKIKIIMQKYATYRGIIANNKVGDLSPITRLACWHIVRDMYIDYDGQCYICSYDIEKKLPLGNVIITNFEDVWSEGNQYYKQDISSSNSFCANCDEWYLFNF